MPVIKNPSFEIQEPNANPGLADDWAVVSNNAEEWRWANYLGHDVDPVYWAVERFDGGWNNDGGYLGSLAPGDLVWFDVDDGDVETFEKWVAGVLMVWEDSFTGIGSDLEAALYAILVGGAPSTTDVEAFESDWNNDEPPEGTYYFTLQSWVDGAAPTYIDPADAIAKYIIPAGNSRITIRVATAFAASFFDVDLAPDTYTVSAMVVELQAKTDAAGAGVGLAPGDILWSQAPNGGVRIALTRTLYSMQLVEPSSISAWDALGFDITDRAVIHWRPFEPDYLEAAQYLPGTLDEEWFDLGWNNDLFDHLWYGVAWIDGVGVGPSWTVTINVNDRVDVVIDDNIGNYALLQLTLTPGVYNLATIVTELGTKLSAALIIAGIPWGAGSIIVSQSPKGQIRIKNLSGTAGSIWLQAPGSRDGWSDLGFDLLTSVIGGTTYPDRRSRRVDERYPVLGEFWDPAMYDAGADEYEDFEAGGGWPVLP